jgi:hypothetical protein
LFGFELGSGQSLFDVLVCQCANGCVAIAVLGIKPLIDCRQAGNRNTSLYVAPEQRPIFWVGQVKSCGLLVKVLQIHFAVSFSVNCLAQLLGQ